MDPSQTVNPESLRRCARDLNPGGCHAYAKVDDQFPEQAPPFIVRGSRCSSFEVLPISCNKWVLLRFREDPRAYIWRDPAEVPSEKPGDGDGARALGASAQSGYSGPVARGHGAGPVLARHLVLLAGGVDAADRVSHPGERARRLPPRRDCRLDRVGLRQVARGRAGDLAGPGAAHWARGPDRNRDAARWAACAAGGLPAEAPRRQLSGRSEQRLKALRTTAEGPLSGKSLVVFNPQTGLALDVFPCANGHAQERALLGAVGDTVALGEVWVADRNFWVSGFLYAIERRVAFFIIRQHGGLTTKPLEAMPPVGTSQTGTAHEQAVELESPAGERWSLRRITVTVKCKTRNGDTALVILTNLPSAVADTLTIVACYCVRWGIETSFQMLERHLNSLIETLGYPQAALFALCLAPVGLNFYAVVMAALRAAHPTQTIDKTVSEYYLAGEIATTTTGPSIAVPEAGWASLDQASPERFTAWILDLAKQPDLRKLRKMTRGPKKPPTPRTRF